jgi:hypothetical protein
MDKPSSQLEHRVFAALECALAEGRLDVAEHLLCALEILCAGKIENTSLNRAYRILARQAPAEARS